jgi:hypothetical protein
MKFLVRLLFVPGNTAFFGFQSVEKLKVGVGLEGIRSPCIRVNLSF